MIYLNFKFQSLIIKKKIKKESLNPSSNKFWLFGGSTTFGNFCEYNQSSSWPKEINKINKKFEYKNFAFNGANTDQQLTLLEKEIVKEQPKSILWASKFNTLNILGYINYRNEDILNYKFKNTKQTNFFLKVKKIDKTLKSNLISYSLLDEIIKRLVWRLNIKKKNYKPSKQDIFYAVKNFEINTIKAIELSKKYGVKEFYLISLFYDNDLKNSDILEKYRFSLYKNSIKNIQNNFKPFVKIIDLDPIFYNKIKSDLLCDYAHKTLKGNILQAFYINEALTKTSLIIND